MHVWIDGLITVFSLGVVLAYVWSVKSHFSSPKTPPRAFLISAAVIVSTILLMWLLWSGEQPIAASLAGLAIELVSAILFAAAVRASRDARLRFAFDPAHPHGLVQTGPYRFLRHPFYVSYVLFWLGWSVATWSPIAIVPPVFVVLYWLAARMEERNFAASPLAAQYDEYRKRVGSFFPRQTP